jgi:hypothetical protein
MGRLGARHHAFHAIAAILDRSVDVLGPIGWAFGRSEIACRRHRLPASQQGKLHFPIRYEAGNLAKEMLGRLATAYFQYGSLRIGIHPPSDRSRQIARASEGSPRKRSRYLELPDCRDEIDLRTKRNGRTRIFAGAPRRLSR